jgi:hypothetical protein
VEIDISLTDDGKRHVGKMDQISGRTDAAAFRNIGTNPAVDHFGKMFKQNDPDTAESLDQRIEPDRQDRTGNIRFEWVSQTCGMAAYQVDLECFDLPVADDFIAHGTERGIDPVNYPLRSDFLFKKITAGLTPLKRGRIKGNLFVPDADSDDILYRNIITG